MQWIDKETWSEYKNPIKSLKLSTWEREMRDSFTRRIYVAHTVQCCFTKLTWMRASHQTSLWHTKWLVKHKILIDWLLVADFACCRVSQLACRIFGFFASSTNQFFRDSRIRDFPNDRTAPLPNESRPKTIPPNELPNPNFSGFVRDSRTRKVRRASAWHHAKVQATPPLCLARSVGFQRWVITRSMH